MYNPVMVYNGPYHRERLRGDATNAFLDGDSITVQCVAASAGAWRRLDEVQRAVVNAANLRPKKGNATFQVDGGTVQMWCAGRTDYPNNRSRYGYSIYCSQRRRVICCEQDLHGGCSGAMSLEESSQSLASFLSAAAEAYDRPGADNAGLFNAETMEWAHQWAEEFWSLVNDEF